MQLPGVPRLRFAHLPTPFEPMTRLTAALGGPTLWVKRDDCTGLAGGGNKTRKLEFLIADALDHGADTVITVGATQSNHCRQTAAAAAKYGLECHLLLENRRGVTEGEYALNGNVMLDHILGANLHDYPGDTDMVAAMDSFAAELKAAGRRPYGIPGGGSNAIGALGYVDCAIELRAQAETAGVAITHVLHGSGSAGTQAGLVVGFAEDATQVVGISVSAAQAEQEEKVLALAKETAVTLGVAYSVSADHVVVNDGYVGEGYGIPTDSTMEAISLFAELEGILLDPVYTGKAAAGMIDLIRNGHFNQDDQVVFVHTGGAQALPSYRDSFG